GSNTQSGPCTTAPAGPRTTLDGALAAPKLPRRAPGRVDRTRPPSRPQRASLVMALTDQRSSGAGPGQGIGPIPPQPGERLSGSKRYGSPLNTSALRDQDFGTLRCALPSVPYTPRSVSTSVPRTCARISCRRATIELVRPSTLPSGTRTRGNLADYPR